MNTTAPEKKGSWHNPQHADWLIRGSVPSFSSKPTNEALGLCQASIEDKLLGLLGPSKGLFGPMVMGVSANLEFCRFSIAHRPGIVVLGEAFWELEAFDTWGELLVALELGLSWPFGISLLDLGPIIEEFGKISRGVLKDGWSQNNETSIMQDSS
jgi:hypothetical protein